MESKSSNQIPIPIHVVVVDSDLQTSLILQYSYGYEVTMCEQANEALVLLRTINRKYIIVITADHLPGDINGFDLLTIVTTELQLPIIMVSSDNSTETKLKANRLGCCEYIVRDDNMCSLKNIWEHVIRHEKKLKDIKLNSQAREQNNNNNNNNNQGDDSDILKDITVFNNNVKEEEGEEEEEEEEEESYRGKELKIEGGIENVIDNGVENHYLNSDMYGYTHLSKKPRLVWSKKLHNDFVSAVNLIGYDKAVPKRILEIMRNMGYISLRRENIASHLQKYREFKEKEKKSLQNSHNISSASRGTQDQNFPTSAGIIRNEFQNNFSRNHVVKDEEAMNRLGAQDVDEYNNINNNNNFNAINNNNNIPIEGDLKLLNRQQLLECYMNYQFSQPIVDQSYDENSENLFPQLWPHSNYLSTFDHEVYDNMETLCMPNIGQYENCDQGYAYRYGIRNLPARK